MESTGNAKVLRSFLQHSRLFQNQNGKLPKKSGFYIGSFENPVCVEVQQVM